jgi:hypothetical protein
MPVPDDFYNSHLAALHQWLLGHDVVRSYLTGTGVRFDGTELSSADRFELPFGEISTLEFAHLFSVFDGSRVHQQAERNPSHDDAPPGLYFTVINNRLIQNQHKNRVGLVTEELGTTGLFIDALHIDHFFLNEQNTPPSLGTFSFTLSAITAHLLGLAHVSLVAAGGKGFNPRHIGYKVWPKLGFDAELLPGELDDSPQRDSCKTVQDVLAVNPAWWEQNGSQRRMTFDLAADSRSWRKLVAYVLSKASVEDPHA